MAESRHIVCPRCDTVNRIPAARLADNPRCGKCRAALLDGVPRELTGATFDREIERNDLPVVVDFWAPWCGPCRAMAPEFEHAAGELKADARFARLNTENEQAIGARHGIRSIPTLVLFRDGRELARRSGALRSADIRRWIASELGAAG